VPCAAPTTEDSEGDTRVTKRINAAFIVVLFALGIVAVPVSAHFTLGRLGASPPYRTDDFDQHVFGVVAYVWPGAGLYGTVAPGFGDYPGYQSPYPSQHPPNLRSDFYQLESSNYAPFGAILTSTVKAGTPFNKMKVNGNPTIETASTDVHRPWVEGVVIEPEHPNRGDLIFALNATAGYTGAFPEATICIPPEFTGIDKRKVACSWTNNYDMISVGRSDMESMIDPGWTRVTIYADPDFPIIFSHRGEWYYVRINDVTAPTIAGRYFFKIFMGAFPYKTDTDPTWILDECPPQNWPILLVKGEVDPVIIAGTIRYGGWNSDLYGLPVTLPGRVRAVGIADDPYTGKSTGRPVEARAYFNHTANGHYEIEGVAPGTYDIYASLAGYPELKMASGLRVLRGQSLHLDGYLSPGVVIHGEVFSKCGTGEVRWKCSDWRRRDEGMFYYWFSDMVWQEDQPIKIEIYKSKEDAEEAAPASSSTRAISWSPAYFVSPSTIPDKQFAWPGYADGPKGFDPDGVGPKQKWRVEASKANFRFMFGDRGLYGAPAEWTGQIPQTYATWVDGVTPSTYFVRAWTHGYVQTMADGMTFEHVSFTVAKYGWPGGVYVVFDLRLGSWIVKEFHLHSIPGTLEDKGFELPSRGVWDSSRTPRAYPGGDYVRYLYLDVKDAKGTRYGWSVREVLYDAGAAERVVAVRGLVGRISGVRPADMYASARSYGIPAGSYTVKGYAAGYIDQKPTTVSMGLCGSEVRFSNHLDRGVIFNVTVYSVDWQHPSVYKHWSWPGENIYLMPYRDGIPLAGAGHGWTGLDYDYSDPPPFSFVERCHWAMPIIMQPAWGTKNYVKAQGYYGGEGEKRGNDRPGYYPLAFETGQYSFRVFTYGYVQKKAFELYATKGATADIPIKIHQGANVTFDITFKRESIFEHLRYDSAVRIRIFNDAGKLAGEALTSDYTKMYVNSPKTNTDLSYSTQPTSQLEAISDYSDDETREFLNFFPSSTMRLRGTIGGLPDLCLGGDNAISAFAWSSPDPFFDMIWTGDPVPAPYGIDAAPNYKGGWYIEVDIVPWYRNDFNEQDKTHATVFYPPPPGVLTGESPKYVPENHWGPYEQRFKVEVPSAHLGGEASVIFELDLRGLLSGNVYTYTHCGDWRTTGWILVLVVAADGKTYPCYTFDGLYELWLTPGTYAIHIIEWTPAKMEGHKVATVPAMPVSEGSQLSMNFYLEQSGVPIPEFTTAALVPATAIAASLFILRRKRKQ